MTESKKEIYGWDVSMGIPLYEKIRQDVKAAMRNKDNGVRDAIRLIMGELPKLTMPITLESGKKSSRVKTPEEITDDDLQTIIRSLAKSEKVVLEVKNEKTSEYLEILNSYLPKMADREEIVNWIKGNIDFSQFKSPMQAMGTIMKHYGKLADGNLVKGILQEMS